MRPLLEELSARSTAASAAAAPHPYGNGVANGHANGNGVAAAEPAAAPTWESAKEAVDVACHGLRAAWPVKLAVGGWAIGQARGEHFLKAMGVALAGHVQVGPEGGRGGRGGLVGGQGWGAELRLLLGMAVAVRENGGGGGGSGCEV